MNTRRWLEHKLTYISWNSEAKKFNLKQEEFTELFNSLDKDKYVKDNTKTRKLPWLRIGSGAWKYTIEKNYEFIYLYKDYHWFIYSSNRLDDEKNKNQEADKGMHLSGGESGGSRAIKEVKRRFMERTGTSFKIAFDTVEESFKINIPKQFYYNILKDNINKYKIKNKVEKLDFIEVSGVDFSSHYPYSACGILPDAHDYIEVQGRVEPSEEYPFAFYNNGHLAIFNELDTRTWLHSEFSEYVFRTWDKSKNNKEKFLQKPYEEITSTILMKASKFKLDVEYQWCYKQRENDELAKLISVASIGCLHTVEYKNNKYAHLAAVIIARCNDKMLKCLGRISKKDVIQVCVDGIIYKGSCKLGVEEKEFGCLHQEFTGCQMTYKGNNVYIVADRDGKVIKSKHGAYNYYDDGRPIDDDNVESLQDINHWVNLRTTSSERQKITREIKLWQEQNKQEQ